MTNKELYERCLELSNIIKKNRNKFISLIPEVEKRKLYLEHGMHTIYEFAAKLGCLSHKTVNRILNISAKIDFLPAINRKFTNGEISWTKLEVIASILDEENQEEYALILPTLSVEATRTLVKDVKGQSFDVETLRESKEVFKVKMGSELMSQLKVLKFQLEKENKQPLSWEQALGIMVAKLQDKNPPKSRKKKKYKVANSRYIPAQKKREVMAQFNQLCAMCNNPAEHLHHQIPYSISKNHESIVPLCRSHHDIAHHLSDTVVNKKYQNHKKLATID
jgi:hypothetical protein